MRSCMGGAATQGSAAYMARYPLVACSRAWGVDQWLRLANARPARMMGPLEAALSLIQRYVAGTWDDSWTELCLAWNDD